MANISIVHWQDALVVKPPVDQFVLIYCPIADPESAVWLGKWDGRQWLAVGAGAIEDRFVDYWATRPEPPQGALHDTGSKAVHTPIVQKRRARVQFRSKPVFPGGAGADSKGC